MSQRPLTNFKSDLFIQAVIVLSLLAFSIETLPDLSPSTLTILSGIAAATIAIFTVEYLLRLWAAEDRFKFATSFLGITDLIAIVPFYVSTGIDLRAVRAVRLLRLFRIFKLARYSSAAKRLHTALKIAREEIILFLCATGILLFLAAAGIHHFEHKAQPEQFRSIFHCFWWAIATLTTVGYGDVFPVTVGGRVFTFAVLLVGLGIVAVPAGLFSAALSKARELQREEEQAGKVHERSGTRSTDRHLEP